MKKWWIWLCVMLLAVSPAYAVPLTPEDAMEIADSYLTEVYSYTAEEAKTFTATVVWEEDHWRINFASAAHPEWIYTGTYKEGEARVKNVETPFRNQNGYENYPGEGAVREGLTRARKGGWFTEWDDLDRTALQQYMTEWGIKPNERLREGLAFGTITAANALYEYFVSCYGEETGWTKELRGWYEAEAAGFGLPLGQAEKLELTDGIVTYEGIAYNEQKLRAVRFIHEVPQDLQQVFSHPKLEGWTCLCGATAVNEINGYGFGLAAFEKDGERLLVGMAHPVGADDWQIAPISKTALYTDRGMAILPTLNEVSEMVILYPNSETETERFELHVVERGKGRMDAALTGYSRVDEAAGSSFQLKIASMVQAIAFENNQKTAETEVPQAFSTMMSGVKIETFPTSVEKLTQAQEQLFPDGYGLVRGVHLRQKTSSRSRNLGEYQAGVLVKLLGAEEGDPDPWYRVQVGSVEGYMSSRYVDQDANLDTAFMLSRPLPVAKAQKDIRLKKGMGLFSGSVTTLPAGTMMHVLADCDGGWLHVSVPQGELGWQMDVNGTDGYLKEQDVLMAGTPLALEWME